MREVFFALLLFALLPSAARADPQAVAGIEIDYPLPFKPNAEIAQRLMQRATDGWGAPLRALEIFQARPFWALSGGIGDVQIIKATFETDNPRGLEAMAEDIDVRMTAPGGGTVFSHAVTTVMVSDREARTFSFEREQQGWRFGGEVLLVSDPASNTVWMIQMLFGRQPATVSLTSDRDYVKKVLGSVRILGP